ncbi:hypothetical protein AZO1586I_64 [Bathymodiolus thermophilus thioautotrophic gill symbiont]|jgi:hypothetical protein|uniref:Lipoprotein n=3 Tax=sulfur-oxidizing symbionts TaxID=32036 RepID=A0A1H6KNA7_9GAMM|nr:MULTISPECIES: transglycosylase SLT domain-containing protein [Gammaproteobacteria]CAC9426938.1 hypothetical protein [uncultured Gammaproteobacteria bacterium]CAB5496754.1 hypothetical protein AZO1586I_64 [Bathymodiolus thermophilus thioautotrophic gill symbiont]CAB5500222.1 hypothetical protein AZO1586R_1057 [Bathymodiolus azoricus thioautotrophic gill symbiont]CAC9494289.1 hypothetical protein [uncultured Gammaproteobacteria bacterium]CAC9506565.1 hypothetical protein [uncultured Gammaprot
MKKLTLLLLSLFLSGCFSLFSSDAITVGNICTLMDEEVRWYKAVKASEKKYGVPMHVQLAIIYQESHFESDARPPREKLFSVIPWFRPTTARGFAQATDATWALYKLKTGNTDASREDFEDAVDFVGWYVNRSAKRSNINKADAYNQYLAYHEGHGGFNRKTHHAKLWLKKVAKEVSANARRYQRQLNQCTSRLDKNSIWSFF